MKNLIIKAVLLAIIATSTTNLANAQQEEYLGLPGDNLNLYAVMKLFQESETLEGFEKELNDQNTQINNLDLNGDNFVDYIRVFDNIDGDVHTIVMQVPVNEYENQDVAVFTVQRFTDGQVQIQLIGDEALYGRNYIIEPIFDVANSGQTPNPGYIGNAEIINGRKVYVTRTTTYEIATWPLVRYIYLPTYRVYRSSWYWGYYPSYWYSWQPHYWHYYYGYHYNWYNTYYSCYRRWDYYRYPRWDNFYYSSFRSQSVNVNIRIESGQYKNTYSRPDQRRQGEALYNNRNLAQNNESARNSTTRRTGSQTTPAVQSTVNSATRRSAATTTNRSVSTTPVRQNVTTARSSAAPATNRSVATTPARQNVSTARSSAAPATNRSVATTPVRQNVSTARSSAAPATNRSVSTAPARQNVAAARSSAAPPTNRSVSTAPARQNVAAARSSAAPARQNSSSAATSRISTSTRASSSGNSSSGSSRPGTTTRSSEGTTRSTTSSTSRR